MITDNELTKWLENREVQQWINYKCRYFARNPEDAQELKAQTLYNCWLYRENYSKSNNDAELKSWFFFIIKYAYFHVLERLYKKPTYDIESFTQQDLRRAIQQPGILSTLQTESILNNAKYQINKKLTKKHLKTFIMSTDGYSAEEIGKELELNERTVYNYREQNKNVLKNKPVSRRSRTVIKQLESA